MAEVTVQLSDREQEVLRLVATGATNQQIANTLNISINTVKVHLRNIFDKIGVASRTEASMYAVRLGLVPMGMVQPEPSATVPIVGTADLPAEPPPLLDVAVVEVEPISTAPLLPATPQDTAAQPQSTSQRHRLLLIGLGLLTLVLAAVIIALLVRPRTNVTGTAPILPVAPQPERWQVQAAPPLSRTSFAVATYDNRLYVLGGQTTNGPSGAVERYDPVTRVWVPLSSKPTPVKNVLAATIAGQIFVPGGESADGRATSIFEAYNPRTEHWETLPALPAPRSRYSLATVEGKLYLLGGWDGTTARAEVWMYDPAAKSWTKEPPLPASRQNAGAVVIDGRIYMIGGESPSGPLRTNDRFDPAIGDSGGWQSGTPLPTAIAAPSVVAVVNTILAFDPAQHTALQYSAVTDSWDTVPLPTWVVLGDRAVSLNTSVFVFGSANGTSPPALTQYQAVYTTFFPNAKAPQ